MKYFIFCFALLVLVSCKKMDDWLDVKANNGDVVPKTLVDFQKLLDNDAFMNQNYPGLAASGTDNFYVLPTAWQNAVPMGKNSYVWAKDIFEGATTFDWSAPYRVVEYANVVLDGLEKINLNQSNISEFNAVKGTALFLRSFAFYTLAQTFALPYSEDNRSKPGIPIRLTSDVKEPSVRTSIGALYTQIVSDLRVASQLLPLNIVKKTRPSAPAANALLSRVFLNMGLYDSSIVYATKTLATNSTLIDFNTLNTAASFPFPNFKADNPEVIFYCTATTTGIVRPNGSAYIDTILYSLYEDDDLRKLAFFRTISESQKRYVFKGTYTGTTTFFGGLSTNEVLLNRSEAYARISNLAAAMDDLNFLLSKRYRNNVFNKYHAVDADSAMVYISNERRKEILFNGTSRWEDLRRWNLDAKMAKELTRIIDGQVYILLPNDPRYVYPIPEIEIRLSGFEQNVR